MIKKIVNYTLVTLSIISFFFGETLIYFSKSINQSQATFETIFMPLMAIGKLSLPFFIIGLFVLNVKNRSYVVGILFLVIGSTVMILGFNSYETWRILLEEHVEDSSFQNNFSGQLSLHMFSMIEGVLILSAGMYFTRHYFTRHYLRKRKFNMKTKTRRIILITILVSVLLYVTITEVDNYFNGDLHQTSIRQSIGNPNECWNRDDGGNLESCKSSGGPGTFEVLLVVFGPSLIILAIALIIVGAFVIWRKRK